MANLKLLVFSSGWCGPCKQIKPMLEEVRESTGADIQIIDIDVDPDIADEYKIRGVPTVVVLENDAELMRMAGTGQITKTKLINIINEHQPADSN